MPYPTDKSLEIESEVPIRKPRRKRRRRRRKRPKISTQAYEEDLSHPVRYTEQLEPDYVGEGYVRRRPIKRRRRPIQRRPLIEGDTEEENILPQRKLIRRPTDFRNKTSIEDVQQWEPITTTEEGKWKPVKTTSELITSTISTTLKSTAITTTTTNTPKMTSVTTTFSTQKFIEENIGTSKISNTSRADMVVLHKRPLNSNLPPTSAVIRRRYKSQNTTLEETTTLTPKISVIKEELPLSLLPPGFKITENTHSKESVEHSTQDYQFNDEALAKIMNEQPNIKNNEFKFKSDTLPKVKDEILSLLKTKTGSLLLSNVLNLRNMSLEELLQHRERGSSQRHQELIDKKEHSIDISSDEPLVIESTKNFTNYLIDTKMLAQKNRNDGLKTEELNNKQLFTDNIKNLTSPTSIKFTDSNEEKQDTQKEYKKNQDKQNNNKEKQDEQDKNETNKQILKQEIKTNNIKSKIPIEISKEEKYDHENISISRIPKEIIEHLNIEKVQKDIQEEEIGKIKLNTIFEEKKVYSFPTTTTYTTAVDVNHQENEATSFVSKSPKTRIVLETSEREPRLFESMPDFTIKTTQRPLIVPTIPSQVLFIQDTNHLDKYQSYGEKNKDIDDDDNNLEYRRFEMRKLPVAVKSAIIASAAILAMAVLGFFVLLISCRMRQRKRVLRKKSVFCQHSLHHDPDYRSSARSTSPVMDQHCQDQYYDGYGGRIDTHTTAANRQYYLWRTLRKTFRYD